VSRPSLECPACGTPMNHHADRLVHPLTEEEEQAMTTALDGVVEHVLACPDCGRAASIRTRPDRS
jgi:ribosomal protein S27AE